MQEREFVRDHPQLALFLKVRGLNFFSSHQELWSVHDAKGERVLDAPAHSKAKRIFFLGNPLDSQKVNELKFDLYKQVESHNDSGEGLKVKRFSITNNLEVADKEYLRVKFELHPRER